MKKNNLRITLTNRTKLETVIPLSTPYLVFLDPSNICNQRCEYCPTSNHGLLRKLKIRPQLMDWEVFVKIINQFKKFPEKVKTLRMYLMGEPLLNPHFPAMVKYAKQTGCFGKIDTTTNGRLLSNDTGCAIVVAGLDKIFISVPKDYDSLYLARIKNFYKYSRGRCEVFVKIAGDYLNEAEKEKFLYYFTPISDSIAIEHTAPCWPEYNSGELNKEVGIYGHPLEPDVLVCPYLFYSLSIHADGTVANCFVGWNHKVLLGDLTKNDTVYSVWNGDVLRQRQIVMLEGRRSELEFCGKCEHNIYGKPDRIDEYREELLNRILKKEK